MLDKRLLMALIFCSGCAFQGQPDTKKISLLDQYQYLEYKCNDGSFSTRCDRLYPVRDPSFR
jgi:hypothetical protein